MTHRIAYMVIATLPTQAVADEYVLWLKDGHVDAVVAGGAHSAMIVQLKHDAGAADHSRRVMTQYIFPTDEVFNRYVEKFAPALRADGLKRFGPETGVRFERLIGEVV